MNHNTHIQSDQNTSSDGSDAPPPSISNLFSQSKEVSLTSEEKASGSLFLKDFMDKNPAGAISAQTEDATKSPYAEEAGSKGRKTFYTEYFKTLYTKKPELIYALAAFVLIFGSASGAVYAAQDSLPGELLYPVKIQVNERVERVAARTTIAKAKVAVKQAVTRLEETKQIIELKRVDAETEAAANMRFSSSSDAVESSIDQLEKEGRFDLAIKINADFEDILNKQEKDISAALEKASTSSKQKLAITREYVRKRISTSTQKTMALKSKIESANATTTSGTVHASAEASTSASVAVMNAVSASIAASSTASAPTHYGNANARKAAKTAVTSGTSGAAGVSLMKTIFNATAKITSTGATTSSSTAATASTTKATSTNATASSTTSASNTTTVSIPATNTSSPIVSPIVTPTVPAVVPAVKSVLGL